jgi:hypothetical protein
VGINKISFVGKMESPDGNGTSSFIEIPAEIVAELGAGKTKPPVRVTLNGYTYPTTVAVYGGQYLVGVRREVREIPGPPRAPRGVRQAVVHPPQGVRRVAHRGKA